MANQTDPLAERRKQFIQLLAKVLRAAHSALIQSLRRRREKKTGKELTPLEWFHLLSSDPEYLWMKPLMSLMADIDALLDNRPNISENDLALVRLSAAALFDPAPSPEDFKNRYFDALAADPALIPTHAALKKTIEAIPVSNFEGEAVATRRSWHISERRLNHLRSTSNKEVGDASTSDGTDSDLTHSGRTGDESDSQGDGLDSSESARRENDEN